MTPPVALTIAGSDSGGAAGIQADLKTFLAHGVFGCSAIAALTAQNSVGVHDIHVPPAAFLQAQLDAVLDDLPVAAVKTGMLAQTELVALVADAADRLPNLVVDPVMVSSTGARLLDDEATATYRDRLIPQAAVITPNLHEARVLLDQPISTRDQVVAAALALTELGCDIAVITGGHPADDQDQAVDVAALAGTGEVHQLTASRIDTTNTHGSGCSYSSAIAANLARGLAPLAAVRAAHAWVHDAIKRSADWEVGAGHGPLDHTTPLPSIKEEGTA